MRVHVLSVGDASTASTYFRFVQYVDQLQKRGIEAILHPRSEVGPTLFRKLDGEVVVLQKILLSGGHLRLLRKHAARLIFDFDDAIWTRPGRPFSLGTRLRVRTRLERCLRLADAVTVASEYLAEYARPHARDCRRIPMTIDSAAWLPRTRDAVAAAGAADGERIAIGWAGSPINLAFLAAVAPALGRLAEERPDVELHVYCGQRPDFPFPFAYQPYAPGTEADFVRRLDIGLCPLEDHEFARGKSPIKILQYLSCAVPVVASRVGASAELLSDAWSRAAAPTNSPDVVDDWYRALSELLSSREDRARLGAAGRHFVETTHDVEIAADRLQAVLSA